MRSLAGTARSCARECALREAAKVFPCFSASANELVPGGVMYAPLSAMAARKRPLASGDAVRKMTAAAPEDWPAMAT